MTQQLPDFSLTGKVALVTGGGRGLGLSMAQGFAAAGAEVVLASRKKEACAAAAAEITRTTGRPAHAYGFHVGHWGEVEPFVEQVYADLGRVDVLVNNAGMSPVYDKLTDVTEELWDKVFDVNLKGAFRLTALVGDRMVAGEGGSIISTSSIAAIRPQPHALPYAAAKAGLNAITVGFARALAPRVRVNAIMAGPFATAVAAAWSNDFAGGVTSTVPLQRMGAPSEIVGVALYLASPAGSFTTGSVITVDGGITVPPDEATEFEGKSF
ncbi:SDR family NAD(P)-dependent oxidoreductase [Dactylosporangium sucinum]|uniref:Short-chain dehydrogenase n=1 Tax=Dactylosporangium sucinum TaxID=1424081 RepID=A0A917UAG0_9ACTN|nr:glucose 1-dehydrogenase [Dactylosporangium sucinum]GGM64629.1 short-chain dehydrogenase [Dactylosporangium sucinum]